jgi:hypothetical protein
MRERANIDRGNVDHSQVTVQCSLMRMCYHYIVIFQMMALGGSVLTVVVVVVIIVGVLFSVKRTGTKIVQVRVCKNKTIFIVFVSMLLIYFMCYTSIWMNVLEFKSSFEKRVKTPEPNIVSGTRS